MSHYRPKDGKDGLPGTHGKDGQPGEKGDIGPMPEHDWVGTNLRFQNPDGDWGEFVDLEGPKGEKGDDGRDGSDGKEGVKGERGPKGEKGERGDDGDNGSRGPIGPMPDHQWRETSLRFQEPDGDWGRYVNLKGDKGDQGPPGVGSRGPQGPQGEPGGPANIAEGDGISLETDMGGVTTISHGDTSSIADFSNGYTDGVVIQQIALTYDQYGHAQTVGVLGTDLDNRYVQLADQIRGVDSVEIEQTTAGPEAHLVNDVAHPDPLSTYATDASGVRGWYRPALFESTGIMSGGQVTINSGNAARFDVAAGFAVFVDYSVNPVSPTRTVVPFGPLTAQVVTGIGVQLVTYIGVNLDGTIFQQSSPLTNTQRRTIAQLAVLVHTNMAVLNAINDVTAPIRAGISQVHDFMTAVGPLNTAGNVVSANGANLSINKSAGQVFKFGCTFHATPLNPHLITLPALTAPSNIRYRLSNGTEFANTAVLDPFNYESAPGVLSPLSGGNRFSVQRIALFTSNLIRIQYGQFDYASLAAAEEAINTEVFNTEANIAENGVMIGYVIMRRSTTALNNTANAKFIGIGKFGAAAASGGGSIANTDGLPEGVINLYFTDERAQDAIGNNLLDTTTIDLTYNDATAKISADVKPNIFVNLAGAETITGVKTFQAAPPMSAPGNPGTGLATAAYNLCTDNAAGNASIKALRGGASTSTGIVLTPRNAGTQIDAVIVNTDGTTILRPTGTGSGATPPANANGLTVDSNADTGVSILSSGTTSRLGFGNSALPSAGRFVYVYSTNQLQLVTNNGAAGASAFLEPGTFRPATNNATQLGNSTTRWSEVFAVNGTINTSDGREKTVRGALNTEELAASKELASKQVIFQWNDSLQEHGQAARLHCGFVVQDVISVMQSHGLDPFRYGFVCYDEWEELPEIVSEGEIVQAFRAAGSSFGLRYNELYSFILAGQEQRLSALELL